MTVTVQRTVDILRATMSERRWTARSFWRHAIAAVFASVLCWACSETPPNVVIIVLDTARPDYLSVYGHPHPTSPYLETFAKSATRYDRAYSVSNWTLPAHASLFSGTLPEVHGATQANRKISDTVPMMAERLAQHGYQTAGFSNNPWVAKHTGLARGFQVFREKMSRTAVTSDKRTVHGTVAAVKEWFDTARKPAQPFFVFVNLIEPHMPYKPTWEAAQPFMPSREVYERSMQHLFPDNRATAITNRHFAGKEPLTTDEWSALKALYEGELRLVDDVTRQLMEIVDSASDPAKTLVFVLSDHGENLGDHGLMSHIFNLYESNVRIACLARGPGFARGAVDEHVVQITDVYPTVMKAAQLSIEAGCAGVDLCGGLSVDRQLSLWQDFPAVTLETFSKGLRESGALKRHERELFAAIGSQYKVICGSDESRELYDLAHDPTELDPLEAQKIGASVLASLIHTIDLARALKQSTPAQVPTTVDPNAIDDLRNLGYVGDAEHDEKGH